MNKNIPKVEFSVASIEDTFWLIHEFLNPKNGDWDWSSSIYDNYPGLKERVSNLKNKKERKRSEYLFFREFLEIEKSALEDKKNKFSSEWNKINDNIIIALGEVVECDWPKSYKVIHARISLNPICPRFIKEKTFDIFYRMNASKMKSIAIHELLHFIYFEKWKSVFPTVKPREFDSPYLVWHLSEMVPRIILTDKRIQKVFGHNFGSYQVYEEAKIEGKPLLSHLELFYNERRDFRDFLNRSWNFVQQHKKEIKAL